MAFFNLFVVAMGRHALGIVNASDPFAASQHLDAAEHVVFIEGTVHCRDMYAPSAFAASGWPDTVPVKWAHAQIRADVARYLS